MATHTSWGHWGPFIICCFSLKPAPCSLGLALESVWGELRGEPGKRTPCRVDSVSPTLLTALGSAFPVRTPGPEEIRRTRPLSQVPAPMGQDLRQASLGHSHCWAVFAHSLCPLVSTLP